MARKIYQYGSTVYQKMQNSNILGGMFCKIKEFFSIFSWENPDLCFLRLQWSSIVISIIINYDFSWKYCQNQLKKKHSTPNVVILHLLLYCGPKLIYLSGQKLHFKIWIFPLIIKSMFSLYNPKKTCSLRKLVRKLNFFWQTVSKYPCTTVVLIEDLYWNCVKF